jgi:hypothetical protein
MRLGRLLTRVWSVTGTRSPDRHRSCVLGCVSSIPLYVQEASVLMAAWLTPAEVSMTAAILNKAPWNRWTGANRMTGLQIQISLGAVLALSGNVSAAGTIFSVCFADVWAQMIIQPGTGNGVQADGCFYQHGPFHQGGSYGAEYTGAVMDLVSLSAGTEFAITARAVAVLETLVLDGQQVSDRCRLGA